MCNPATRARAVRPAAGPPETGNPAIRILILSNLFPPHHLGGYELRCREVAEGLRRRGHRVRVLTGRYRAAAAISAEPHVGRTLLLSLGPPWAPEDLPGLLAAECADRRALAKALRALRPDVVDVWGMEFASQSLVAALLRSSLPVHLTLEDKWLLDAAGRDPLCSLAHVAGRLGIEPPPGLRRLCGLGPSPPAVNNTPVCFVSEALSEAYAEAGFRCPNGRVRLAGIDTRPFRDARPPPEPPPFVIVSAGQLTESRGQADLIVAAGRVAAERRRWALRVRIIGGGSAAYSERLHRLARDHASERFDVTFTGPQPAARVAEFYAGAHLFAHTSRLPEGLPRVLMEAMAAGVPVIATSTGGQRDILDGGRRGTLLPPGDTGALARAIAGAMDHLPERLARARAARRHALQHFDLDHYIEAHAADLAEARSSLRPGSIDSLDAGLPAPAAIAAFSRSLGDAAEIHAASCDAARDPEWAWRLGVALKRTGRLPAADELFNRLLDAHGGEAVHVRRAAFHLAELALLREDGSEAARLLEACLAVAPDHARAAFDLSCANRRCLPEHLAGLAGGTAPNVWENPFQSRAVQSRARKEAVRVRLREAPPDP